MRFVRNHPRFFSFLFLSFLLSAFNLNAAPKLYIGAEYRLRGIQLNNPTFGTEGAVGANQTIDLKYYSQRARIYITGKFDPGIEVGSVIQSLGVAGSTVSAFGRYPKEDFTPFI